MTSPNDPGKPPEPGKAELGKKAADLIAELSQQAATTAQAVRGASRDSARSAGRRQRMLGYVLAGMLALVAVYAVVASGFFSKSTPIPDGLVGVWRTSAPSHRDRTFEITKTTLVFQIGEADYTIHPITRVKAVESEDGTLFTVDYTTSDEVFEFSFYYTATPEPVIRFKNQRQMEWKKEAFSVEG